MGLVDRLQRAQSHGDRGKLPVVGHQPRVGVGGQAVTAGFTTKIIQLLFAQTPLQKGTSINTRRGMTLKVNQVTGPTDVAVSIRRLRRPEKVIEANIVECRGRGKAGDMPAQIARTPVGAHHHGQSIPANQTANSTLHEQVTGHRRFVSGRNGIAIGSRHRKWQAGTGSCQSPRQTLQQSGSRRHTFTLQNAFERIQPFFLFFSIKTLQVWMFHSLTPFTRA